MQKILIGLILIVGGLILYNFFLKAPSFGLGEKAPLIKNKLITGEAFNLADLQGKYVLIDFWGSWCGPCRKEIPALKSLYADYNGKKYKNAEDFEILSIALEKSNKYTKQLIKSEGLVWPNHIIDVAKIVMLSDIAQQYDVKELPTKFLLNPNGEFMGTDLSFDEMRRLLDERLAD